MAYGKIKADTLVYDNGGSDVEKTVASLAAAAPTADPTFTGTINGAALTLSGNLTVNGTTTTIDSTTLTVEDKNIELGKVDTPTDTTADGGGITLKGDTDKEIKWVDSTDAATFNQNISTTGNITVSNTQPKIFLTDTNNASDYSIQNENGNLNFYDESNSASRLRIVSTGDATFSGTVSDSKGNLRNIPQNAQTSAYIITASDAGKHIRTDSNVTLNNSTLSVGDAVTIVNYGSSDITITQGSGVSLHLAGNGTGNQGDRTLVATGVCTILYVGSSQYFASGAGLS